MRGLTVVRDRDLRCGIVIVDSRGASLTRHGTSQCANELYSDMTVNVSLQVTGHTSKKTEQAKAAAGDAQDYATGKAKDAHKYAKDSAEYAQAKTNEAAEQGSSTWQKVKDSASQAYDTVRLYSFQATSHPPCLHHHAKSHHAKSQGQRVPGI